MEELDLNQPRPRTALILENKMNELIESTKKVYLDGQCYIRVCLKNEQCFHDVPIEIFDEWLDVHEEYQI